MHIAAQAPIAIDEKGINKEILDKELEIIKEELKNSGKKSEMIEKISKGKIKKFISDNTLLDQIWIMDTKKKVSQVIKEYSDGSEIKVLDFVRYKVGEGNKVMAWDRIADYINLSIQGCINIHNKAIEQIKQKLKEQNA